MTFGTGESMESAIEQAKEMLIDEGYLVLEPHRLAELRAKWHAIGVMLRDLGFPIDESLLNG